MSRTHALRREAYIRRLHYRIDRMAAALRAAKRVLARERREQVDCFTGPGGFSYEQMNVNERAAIRSFDRAIAKINEALR